MHECFCKSCNKPNGCPVDTAVNQYNAVVKQNKSLQKELNELKNKEILKKENKSCPSYDNGDCETYPTPYTVKCKNIDNCRWKDFDFCPQEDDAKMQKLRNEIVGNFLNGY